MNVALLNDYEIDIESLGIELEDKGYERNEAINNQHFKKFLSKLKLHYSFFAFKK